jgi:hypothetical protein
VGLPFLRAVDAAEADTFRVLVVEDFAGVTVEDGGSPPRSPAITSHPRALRRIHAIRREFP